MLPVALDELSKVRENTLMMSFVLFQVGCGDCSFLPYKPGADFVIHGCGSCIMGTLGSSIFGA